MTCMHTTEKTEKLLAQLTDIFGSIATATEQLANELGTARVVVSRLLKSLEEDGKLKLGRNKIELLS